MLHIDIWLEVVPAPKPSGSFHPIALFSIFILKYWANMFSPLLFLCLIKTHFLSSLCSRRVMSNRLWIIKSQYRIVRISIHIITILKCRYDIILWGSLAVPSHYWLAYWSRVESRSKTLQRRPGSIPGCSTTRPWLGVPLGRRDNWSSIVRVRLVEAVIVNKN